MNIVHSLYPFELIFGFELLGHALGFCRIIYEPREHFLCLFVYLACQLGRYF